MALLTQPIFMLLLIHFNFRYFLRIANPTHLCGNPAHIKTCTQALTVRDAPHFRFCIPQYFAQITLMNKNSNFHIYNADSSPFSATFDFEAIVYYSLSRKNSRAILKIRCPAELPVTVFQPVLSACKNTCMCLAFSIPARR